MPPPDAWASDILVSVALALFAAYLEFQPPFERHLVSETLHRVSFPHTPKQTFPTWTLPCLGVFIPVSIIFLASLAPHARVDRARHRSQTQRAVVGLLLAVTLGFAVTNALKNAVGAFRPDFKTRCWPNDAPVRWASTGVPTCSPGHDERLVSEGRKSFPSGHASMAFSGLTFAARVVANRVGLGAAATAARGNKQGAWRLVATISPLFLALFVAVGARAAAQVAARRGGRHLRVARRARRGKRKRCSRMTTISASPATVPGRKNTKTECFGSRNKPRTDRHGDGDWGAARTRTTHPRERGVEG